MLQVKADVSLRFTGFKSWEMCPSDTSLLIFHWPAHMFPDQQELLESLFPCVALAVPGAQVLDSSALGRELGGDTGR